MLTLYKYFVAVCSSTIYVKRHDPIITLSDLANQTMSDSSLCADLSTKRLRFSFLMLQVCLLAAQAAKTALVRENNSFKETRTSSHILPGKRS